jgi:hypothetical protein
MSFLFGHLGEFLGTDWQTAAVIAALCASAAYFIKDYLAQPLMIIFVYPFLVLFSLLVLHGFTQLELFAPKKLDQWLMWTIMASICGITVGLVMVAAVGALRERLGRRA